MGSLWTAFWTEFSQQTLFNQTGFLLALLGIPTLIGMATGWSSNSRLRRLAEGRQAEVRILETEINKLRESSFSHNIANSDVAGIDFESNDLLRAFDLNRSLITYTCERLSSYFILDHWIDYNSESLKRARYYSKVALAVDPTNIIAMSVFGIADYSRDESAERIDANLLAGTKLGTDAIRQHTVDVISKVMGFIESRDYDTALLVCRLHASFVSLQNEMREDIGYNTSYLLCRSLIMSCRGKIPSKEKQFEIQAAFDLWYRIISEDYPGSTDPSYFVYKFHRATALHLFGHNDKALQELENDDLPTNVSTYTGPASSVTLATRHLYANLLYVGHRPEEAVQVVSALKIDLARLDLLSKGHIETYDNWRRIADAPAYKKGQAVKFPNVTDLFYNQARGF